jgi:hypothetical protein
MRKEDDGSLLIRRRLKEAKLGARDWLCDLHPSFSFYIFSPYLQPLYWNAIKFFHLMKSRLSDHKVQQLYF